MIVLSHSQVLILHEQLIRQYGGSHGLRDGGLLDSALQGPFQTFGGIDLYPSILEKPPVSHILLLPIIRSLTGTNASARTL